MSIQLMSVSITAIFGLLGSFITFYLTKKLQIKSEERKIRQEYYRTFIRALSDVAIDNSDDEAQKRLSEGFNSLIVVGAPQVVQKLMEFHDFVRRENKEFPRNSPEWAIKHDQLLRTLIKSIRKDLYGKEKNIDFYISKVHLTGRKIKSNEK